MTPSMQPKHPIQAIVFDFDGVVADTVWDIAKAANFVLAHYSMEPLTVDAVRGLIGGGAEPLVRKMLKDRCAELFDEAIVLFKQRYSACYNCDTCLYPGVRETLVNFHGRALPMGIATNKMERLTNGLLDTLYLRPYFKVIVGPESISHRKPDPEAVLKVLAVLGVAPERAIMIGDTGADILSGKNAGTLTCGVTYGYGSWEEIAASQPDFTIHRFSQLLEIV